MEYDIRNLLREVLHPETGENPISDAQYTLYKSILAYGEAAKEILK